VDRRLWWLVNNSGTNKMRSVYPRLAGEAWCESIRWREVITQNLVRYRSLHTFLLIHQLQVPIRCRLGHKDLGEPNLLY